ncbi:MAG: DUF3179 domain-containing protein [Rhizobiales bacterium]|nr:DUF3179 domain-containing protein [Hyphomicrobiales bacterium]
MRTILSMAITVFVALGALTTTPQVQAQENPQYLAERAAELFDQVETKRRAAIEFFVARGKADAAPALIEALRFSPRRHEASFLTALETITKAKPGRSWHDWMIWQERNAAIGVFPGFDAFKARVLSLVDPAFQTFVHSGVRHDIRLEEIAWGGVPVDGIPALTNPKLIAANDATYLGKDDLVFGVAIAGDIRAYPLRILDWHEMFNDVVGGVPVSLAYCTLCGSGILFDTRVVGREEPFVFGSSGLLYRSNKLMYDQQTKSLWNQFTGRPVVGPLTGSGIELKTLPVVITSWEKWRTAHPQTKVLSLATGHRRDYRAGAAYGEYFSSPNLMFPTSTDDRTLAPKDYVFALRGAQSEKAWPLDRFKGGAVINDRVGALDLVLVGDAETRTVRAFRRDGIDFKKGASANELIGGGETWTVTEDELIAASGRRLTRLPGHIAYWFAWSGYFGATGELSAR